MEDTRLTLTEQAEKILDDARKKGVHTNFFFVTTFKRYQVQMQILNELEKSINEIGYVYKEVGSRKQETTKTNPAINDYNKTATAANGTVAALINIVEKLSKEGEGAGLAETMKELLGDE